MNLKILSQVCQFKEPMKMDLELGNKTLSLLFSDEFEVKKICTNNYELFIDDVSIAKVDPNTRESPYLVEIKPFSNFSLVRN
jgi:hypothetical protein